MSSEWRAFPARQWPGRPVWYTAYVGREVMGARCCRRHHRTVQTANQCAEKQARLLNREVKG